MVGWRSKRGCKGKERGPRKRYKGNKNAAGWEEYAKARKDVKKMVEKIKRGVW